MCVDSKGLKRKRSSIQDHMVSYLVRFTFKNTANFHLKRSYINDGRLTNKADLLFMALYNLRCYCKHIVVYAIFVALPVKLNKHI
jgi:hypothetical protein